MAGLTNLWWNPGTLGYVDCHSSLTWNQSGQISVTVGGGGGHSNFTIKFPVFSLSFPCSAVNFPCQIFNYLF